MLDAGHGLPEDNWRVNREGNLVGDRFRTCSRCKKVYEPTNRMTICKPCNSKRVIKGTPAQSKMLARAKGRAKEKGLPFDITKDDLQIPAVCPVLGIGLVITEGKSGAFKNSPSLDKIVPELGYVKGNVRVISQLANQMKGAATAEELHAFADWIKENVPQDSCA
jgi:hypothetical protein